MPAPTKPTISPTVLLVLFGLIAMVGFSFLSNVGDVTAIPYSQF